MFDLQVINYLIMHTYSTFAEMTLDTLCATYGELRYSSNLYVKQIPGDDLGADVRGGGGRLSHC